MDSFAKTTAAPAGDLVKESNMAGFMADVVQASMQVPVLVDFWAPWCGPCKQLGPMLEKIVRGANGKLKLVKVNIDEPQNQPLAQQLRIQSIPAVYAFFRGQPVDGFVGALPESQLKQFVQRLVGDSLAPDPVEQLVEHGRAALDQGDAATALQAFTAAVKQAPDNAPAIAGLVRARIASGDLAGAKQALQMVPPALANHTDIAAARSAVTVAEETRAASGKLTEVQAKVAANPADHQARFDLALALLGAGQREQAAAELLEIVRRERKWNDEAARKQLVKLFEAWGPTDPLTIDTRRRLSSMLFA